MIDLSKDIHSLTDFKRDTGKHMARLKRTGRAQVLTVNGKAELVVQDATAYQAMLDRLDEADAANKVREALDRMARGVKGVPARRAIEKLAKQAGISLRRNGRSD